MVPIGGKVSIKILLRIHNMQTVRPQNKASISVVALDRSTGKSRSMTIYRSTPAKVISFLRRAIQDTVPNGEAKASRRTRKAVKVTL